MPDYFDTPKDHSGILIDHLVHLLEQGGPIDGHPVESVAVHKGQFLRHIEVKCADGARYSIEGFTKIG